MDAAIRSLVRSEVAVLINQEMEKKLADVTPHSIQVAISGQIEKEIKKSVEGAFKYLNDNGIHSKFSDWQVGPLFMQKIVLYIREELKDKLWKYVSSKMGFDLNPKIKKGE